MSAVVKVKGSEDGRYLFTAGEDGVVMVLRVHEIKENTGSLFIIFFIMFYCFCNGGSFLSLI
jgi:hypothetical protein